MFENQPRWVHTFNSISSTNMRIFVTLLIAFGTAVDYWFGNVAPDNNWLMFLVALAGVDALHFASKRFSDQRRHPPQTVATPAVSNDVTATTDIMELSQNKG